MNKLAHHVIDNLGGTAETAKICECRQSSVSEWRKTGIPKARLQFLRAAYPQAFVGFTTMKKSKVK